MEREDGIVSAAIRADLVLKALAHRHTARQRPDLFLTQVKTGATWDNRGLLIFDALAITRSWAHPRIIGYEVKVDRGDFLRDTKWPGYLKYCHEFYFVCPAGLIQPEELSPGVGLMCYMSEGERLITKRRAAHRDIELSWELFYYIAICRTDSDRHPFFNNRREFLEAWLGNKEETRQFGRAVGSRMAKELESLSRRVEDLETELEAQGKAKERLEQLQDLIADALGVKPWYEWDLYVEQVAEALKLRLPGDMRRAIALIEDGLSRLRATTPKGVAS